MFSFFQSHTKPASVNVITQPTSTSLASTSLISNNNPNMANKKRPSSQSLQQIDSDPDIMVCDDDVNIIRIEANTKRTKIDNKKNELNQTPLKKNQMESTYVQTDITEQSLQSFKDKSNQVIDELFKKAKEHADTNVKEFLKKLDELSIKNNTKMTKHKKCLNVDFNTLNKHVRLKTMLKDIQIDSLKTNSQSKPKENKINEQKNSLNDVEEFHDCPTQVESDGNKNSENNNHEMENEILYTHPAPFPPAPITTQLVNTETLLKEIPPLPELSIVAERRSTGPAVILTWSVPLYDAQKHEKIRQYELFGYREKDITKITSDAWKLIGSIPPYTPPVKCTLTDFLENSIYYFTIRIRDEKDRYSSFSEPAKIEL